MYLHPFIKYYYILNQTYVQETDEKYRVAEGNFPQLFTQLNLIIQCQYGSRRHLSHPS